MQIKELERYTGVSAKTIRYYEEIELLPPPNRKPNGYRDYSEADIERLKLVSGARRLDFSLAEIKEILDLRDRGIAPCDVLLDLLDRKVNEIDRRIAELKEMQEDLKNLYSLGATYPTDDVEGKNCVCHLV
jgi:DNA-binding transcriptional MerR regulator